MRTANMFMIGMMGWVLSQGLGQAQIPKKGSADWDAKVQFSDTALNKNSDLLTVIKTVPPLDGARVPVPYLSITKVTVTDNLPLHFPSMRVNGFYHNYNRKTVSGATFSLEQWDGKSWMVLKSGSLNPILANKGGSEGVDITRNLPNLLRPLRFKVTPSVEGSKVWGKYPPGKAPKSGPTGK